MTKYIHLEWDSIFFGFKVAKVYLEKNIEEVIDTLNELYNDDYKLIYIYSNFLIEDNSILLKMNGSLVDKKVTLITEINDNKSFQENIDIKDVSIKSDDIVKLAIESGNYSRFKIDKNFQAGKFEKMYTQWIENSVSRKIADHVLVFKQNKGLLTLKHNKGESIIGLLAVNQNSRGERIGTKLIMQSKKICMEHNHNRLKVTTQLDNEIAMKFYANNGFEIEKVEYIYHFWQK